MESEDKGNEYEKTQVGEVIEEESELTVETKNDKEVTSSIVTSTQKGLNDYNLEDKFARIQQAMIPSKFVAKERTQPLIECMVR